MQPAISAPPVAPALPLRAALLKEGAVARFESRTARVGVIGLGYVGLPSGTVVRPKKASCDGVRYRQHQDRHACLFAVLPETEIALARDRGFQAATDFTFVSEMDAIIICVPTPLTEYHEPDLS
jgi:UDP-N-acetyl-D-glucosamine dehydrogenase